MNTLAVACVLMVVGVAVAHRGGGGGSHYRGYYGGSDDEYDYRAMMVKKALSGKHYSSVCICPHPAFYSSLVHPKLVQWVPRKFTKEL